MTARKRGSLALPRSPLRGGSGLLARGGNPPHPHTPTLPPIGAPIRRAVGLPCTVVANSLCSYAPVGWYIAGS